MIWDEVKWKYLGFFNIYFLFLDIYLHIYLVWCSIMSKVCFGVNPDCFLWPKVNYLVSLKVISSVHFICNLGEFWNKCHFENKDQKRSLRNYENHFRKIWRKYCRIWFIKWHPFFFPPLKAMYQIFLYSQLVVITFCDKIPSLSPSLSPSPIPFLFPYYEDTSHSHNVIITTKSLLFSGKKQSLSFFKKVEERHENYVWIFYEQKTFR